MIKEIKNLEKEILNTFYSLFWKSKYEDWYCLYTGKTYKFLKDNLVIFMYKEDKTNNRYIAFFIFATPQDAKNSGMSNTYSLKYTKKFRIRKILNFRYNNKFNNLIKFFNNKAEYEKLKSAYESLPLKAQRKGKLEKLNNAE